MSGIVLDASILVKWFKTQGEQHVVAARRLRTRFEVGKLLIVVPPLLFSDLLNLAARGWGWNALQLEQFARALKSLGLCIAQPDLSRVARWSARGLTAYDACYVALAEERNTYVVTADDQMLAIGGNFVRSLTDAGVT